MKIILIVVIIIVVLAIIGTIGEKLGWIDSYEDEPEDDTVELTEEEKKIQERARMITSLVNYPEAAMFPLGEEYISNYTINDKQLNIIMENANTPKIFTADTLNNAYLNNVIKFKKEYLNNVIVIKDKISKTDYIDDTIHLYFGDGHYYNIEEQEHKQEIHVVMMHCDYEGYEDLLSNVRLGEEACVIGILSDFDFVYTVEEGKLFGYKGKMLDYAKKLTIEMYDRNAE